MREVQLRLTKQDHTPSPLSQPLPPHSQPLSLADSPSISPFKSMRITIPRYSGGNPKTWIQKIEHYYSFHRLSDQDKLTLTSFYMDGPAEEWYLWLTKTNRVSSWPEFLTALHNCFGSSKYRDLRDELTKLMQTSTVAAYQQQFESLSNQITGLDELFLQSCFESGLKLAIRREVCLHLPTSLDQAIKLSKLIEDKLQDGMTRTTPPVHTPPPRPGILPTMNQPPFPIKRLTLAEILEKHAKDLCYNCDEQFTCNHIYKGKLFALLLKPDTSAPADISTNQLHNTDPSADVL